jgi:hypothetical protein
MKLIKNPCKSICKIKDNVCIGCKRTSDEITDWDIMTNDEKKLIITRIKDNNDSTDTY